MHHKTPHIIECYLGVCMSMILPLLFPLLVFSVRLKLLHVQLLFQRNLEGMNEIVKEPSNQQLLSLSVEFKLKTKTEREPTS